MISVEELAQLPVFEKISPAKLAYLARSVPDIRVAPGEYVVKGGNRIAIPEKPPIMKHINSIQLERNCIDASQ